ncbi:hypothetical protein FGRMN_1072 [Fusarium graminum]|nr:hypothetical protein FGRMN_1072 [Fusarium graminum]
MTTATCGGNPGLCHYNAAVEELRETEYPMIQDSIYLDHAGSTLCSKSLIDAFAREMTTVLYGNPHSASPSSQQSTSRVEDARMNLLTFFGADPADYDVVFVANATAGVKLVVDAMRTQPNGFFYAYHQASHTSLVGVREEAITSTSIDDDEVSSWSNGRYPFQDITTTSPPLTLFAYPAQSHMDGKRYPLSWAVDIQKAAKSPSHKILTLLDASSFVATSRLDFSDSSMAPDFTVLSLYKIFGFPDLGALIVKRSSEWVFDNRKYFGGGTVDMVVSGKEKWHAPKSQFLHERLEDGTLPFHNIVALDIAMETHRRLFGSMDKISSHTSYLAQRMLQELGNMRHANGAPVCSTYTTMPTEKNSLGTGPIISFNLKNSHGAWISLSEFEKLANLKNIHIRTGGLCSPGGIASALDLQPWEMKKNFSAGFRCGADSDIMSGKPTGVIRASLGAMSTEADVDGFIAFIKEFYQESTIVMVTPDMMLPKLDVASQLPALKVKTITVYPIKSCAGFTVPSGVPWEVRPEGLAWDREWCLVHHGSGHALSQKRCPKMALLRPVLDFEKGELVVTYHDPSVVNSDVDRQSSRPSKTHAIPGSFPDVPSPPDSDSEQQKSATILLSNESPMLVIHRSSVDALNEEIASNGGRPVDEKSFRANIVLEQNAGSKPQPAFSEDSWDSMHIGHQNFKLMGEKKEEPFVTLAKTRRFDGKVYFGVHMRHDVFSQENHASKESQYPTIEVGDSVSATPRG